MNYNLMKVPIPDQLIVRTLVDYRYTACEHIAWQSKISTVNVARFNKVGFFVAAITRRKIELSDDEVVKAING